MKKLTGFVVVAVVLTSCSVTKFAEKDFSSNYQLGMTSKKERALVEKIPVFLTEKDVPKPFNVISVNRYSPMVLPVIGNVNKALLVNLYQKAVKEAESQNGDAVLIVDEAHFKVLSYNK